MTKLPGGKLSNASTALTRSILLPFLSADADLRRKGFLVPALVTVAAVVGMFAAIGNPSLYFLVLGSYLAVVVYGVVYVLCGKSKPWWLLIGAAAIEVLIMISLLPPFIYVFREILPGTVEDTPNANILNVFVGHFFGAGLMEELMKALPVLIVLLLGRQLRSPHRERIGVWEPLDGILLGAASAVGFTMVETLLQYVPITISAVAAEHGTGAGLFVGMSLMIPRVMASLFGHVAYSGYFGYFIGLAVLRPRYSLPILLVGYISAATIHALWNASSSLGLLPMLGVGGASYVMLAAAILKARRLSPTRSQNFATQLVGGAAGLMPAALMKDTAIVLRVRHRHIPLTMGTRITKQEIPGLLPASNDDTVAEVNQNPQDPAVLGLKNLSRQDWTAILPNGQLRRLSPGKTLRLAGGVEIDFGVTRGSIA